MEGRQLHIYSHASTSEEHISKFGKLQNLFPPIRHISVRGVAEAVEKFDMTYGESFFIVLVRNL